MRGPWVFLPLAAFVALVALMGAMLLGDRNPAEVDSALVGRAAPTLTLYALEPGGEPLVPADLRRGVPVIVNFFASWCVPCRAEHESLMALAGEHKVQIIGIAYKDKPAAARAFLEELGNPYDKVVLDESGRAGIEWGVSGVPETFVIDGDGMVRYRHWGPVVGDALETRLLPAVEAAR
ncbi:DsbE family thiol:disulfide interchange protein [Pseudokordiimonas caeni]|uniref:DsbE family thiol:disulfide interchange protein n=1 Tax=Pseudokordiimonas caeni TaxID=2997908 RepID=UPI0028110FA4|nr:DsbE family thiol:disulfide interchange protein [Pseudokordiimonas caeni]